MFVADIRLTAPNPGVSPMHKIPATTPITTANLLRGLMALPWSAPLPFGTPVRR